MMDGNPVAVAESIRKLKSPPEWHGRRLVGFRELWTRHGRGRSENAFRVWVWRAQREGRFPLAVRIGPNSVAWWSDEIDFWEEELPRSGQEAT